MAVAADHFGRVLLFVAHPDDETIGCSALLQRASEALVVFAVDGAPPHYGFESKFGSLRNYSETRFREASRALGLIPHCSLLRLSAPDGTWFVDQHLFLNLPEAFRSLLPIASEFAPDLLVSHAFEGGHIDHDACHVLAKQTARALNLRYFEFPLYWRSERGQDIFQRFRENHADEFVLKLTPPQLLLKRGMLAEYQTQQSIASVFQPQTERFRPMIQDDFTKPTWSGYPFENRRRQLRAELFFRKIEDFHQSSLTPATDERP
jgi:N-acetylglucosamine malate deacetylase 2